MGGFRIRPGTVKDIKELTRQRHRMFEDMGHASTAGLKVHDREFPAWARREIRARRLFCFLAETEDGRVVGGGSLWLREVQPYPGFPGGKVPYLMSMYTDPNLRGKGIGTMVAKHAIAWGRSHGYFAISLHGSKKGRPLYMRLGWQRTWEMELDL